MLAGTFLSSWAVALFSWGTWLGVGMIAIAFLIHLASVVDAVSQPMMPRLAAWVPITAASTGLGLGCYAPALLVLSMVAAPERFDPFQDRCVLVDRWAYRTAEPRSGEWVWCRNPKGEARLARVVALSGQSAELFAGTLRVNGKDLPWTRRPRSDSLLDLALVVPEQHLLVAVEDGDQTRLEVLPRAQVTGRAWLHQYPLRDRRILLASTSG
jgi:hypothetical protein